MIQFFYLEDPQKKRDQVAKKNANMAKGVEDNELSNDRRDSSPFKPMERTCDVVHNN